MIIFEINNTYVKVVWGKESLPLKDAKIDGMECKQFDPMDQTSVFSIVNSLISEAIYKKYKPLILSIPRDQAILRNLNFPTKDENELEDIIELHLTQEVPYSREEIIYDYSVLEKTEEGFSKILLSIVQRKTLLKQFAVFEKLNLYPDNILLSTFGLLRFFQKIISARKDSRDLFACLDIGDEFTDFFLIKDDNMLFSKSIAVPGNELKEEKLARFIGELRQAVMVANEGRAKLASNVYVTGITKKDPELIGKIGEIFKSEPIVVNPVEVISSVKNVKNAGATAEKISIASFLGIALNPLSKRLSFVLPEVNIRKYASEMAKNLFLTGGVVTYLIILMLAGFMGKSYNAQSYLNRLLFEGRTVERMNENAMEKLQKIKSVRVFLKDKDSFLYYYHELSLIMPQSINVDRLIFIKKKEFSIVGMGSDMGEIFKFVRSLNNSKIFGEAELRYSRKITKKNTEFNEFNIMCHIG